MSDTRKALGFAGQAYIRQVIENLGGIIIAENWTIRGGEIDLIYLEGATLIFVEVKTRNSQHFGTSSETLSYRQQQTLIRSIYKFLAQFSEEPDWRGDLYVVYPYVDGYRYEYFADVIEA